MTVTAQATFAATLVDEWMRAGVSDAVVAPGSRSTPLALALARESRARLHVVLDERSAGFFALGLGLGSGQPAVVVTTSGTAAVELHPAVVEAHHAGVPLIACTADRPPELQSVGAPQTVDQSRLFGGAVRWFAEPGGVDGFPPSAWRSLASRAVAESVSGRRGPGPVHLNLAFRDPLVGEAGEMPPGRDDAQPWHRAMPARAEPADLDLRGRSRGLIIAGFGCDPAAVAALSEWLRWPVLADPRSGLRGHPHAVSAFDGILRVPSFAAGQRPDVIVRVGAPPASKVLAQWAASCDAVQVVVDPYGRWDDPERTASIAVTALPVIDADPSSAEWLVGWREAEACAQSAIDDVLATTASLTEPGIARIVTAAVPPDATLFASSSMPIRDLEWFGHPQAAGRVLANRGANGIDGVVSTALGVAASGDPVVALLGDLAFLHDAGGLLGAARRDVNCVFVVVDNDGGGIFSFLPQAVALPPTTFETLFGTPHGLDLTGVAQAYGVSVVRVHDPDHLEREVLAASGGDGVSVVVVESDRAANVGAHDRLNAAIAASISA